MNLLSGLRAWAVQRVSAVLLLGFVLWFAARLLLAPPDSYDQWRALVAHPTAEIALTIFFAALLAHAWVGVRDIVLDYVRWRPLRAAILVGVAAGLLATAAAIALAALHAR